MEVLLALPHVGHYYDTMLNRRLNTVVKLGCGSNYCKGRAALRIYANAHLA